MGNVDNRRHHMIWHYCLNTKERITLRVFLVKHPSGGGEKICQNKTKNEKIGIVFLDTGLVLVTQRFHFFLNIFLTFCF